MDRHSGQMAVARRLGSAETDPVETNLVESSIPVASPAQAQLQVANPPGEVSSLASDAVLAMALDTITDGVLLTDCDGVIVYASAPLLDMFGYEAGELLGQPTEILLPEYVRRQHRDHVIAFHSAPHQRPMGRGDLDIEGCRADGTVFAVDVQLSTLTGTTLVVATIRDVTAVRHASVDYAINKIDLTNARSQVARLEHFLDLVIQQLFALGTSISASASNGTVLAERLATALQGIDQIIDIVQESRQPLGPDAQDIRPDTAVRNRSSLIS